MKSSGQMNKRLNFGGDPHRSLDTAIVLRIRHYWEIRKLVRKMAAPVRRALA